MNSSTRFPLLHGHLSPLSSHLWDQDDPPLVVEVLPGPPLLPPLGLRPPNLLTLEDDVVPILISFSAPPALFFILLPDLAETAPQITLACPAMGVSGGPTLPLGTRRVVASAQS